MWVVVQVNVISQYSESDALHRTSTNGLSDSSQPLCR